MLNKKRLFLIVLLLIIIIFIIICIRNNKKVVCNLNDKNTSIKIDIDRNKSVSSNYKYTYDKMDNVVDKYDEVYSYLKFIKKRDGIKTSIKQEGYDLTYKIDIDLKKVNKKDYELLNISNIVKKSKKSIKKYYKKLGYTCK